MVKTQTHAKEMVRYEKMKAEAVATQNGSDYVEACVGLGIEPEFSELYSQGLAEIHDAEVTGEAKVVEGGLDNIADPNSNDIVKFVRKTRKLSKNREKYRLFIGKTKQAGVDVDRVMADIRTKRNLLIDVMGYRNLMGPGGRVNILEVKDSRIGEAYKSCYNQARKEHPDL